MTKIYTNCQDDITCPHCGYKDRNSCDHELSDGDSEVIECSECEGLFEVFVSVSITYSTEVVTQVELERRKAKKELHRARTVERMTRRECDRANRPEAFERILIRANHDTVLAEIALAALQTVEPKS